MKNEGSVVTFCDHVWFQKQIKDSKLLTYISTLYMRGYKIITKYLCSGSEGLSDCDTLYTYSSFLKYVDYIVIF